MNRNREIRLKKPMRKRLRARKLVMIMFCRRKLMR